MFIVDLWDSVFTPGTTPALIAATHGSFVLLIISLITLAVLTKSIHFVNLLVIAVLLYAAVIWFINELKNIKLKDNDELTEETKETKEGEAPVSTKDSSKPEIVKENTKAAASGVQTASPIKKRKT